MRITALVKALGVGTFLVAALASSGRGQALPTPQQMAESREDLWAEAAIKQPGGPSYEFLAPPVAAATLCEHGVPALPGRAQCARGRGEGPLDQQWQRREPAGGQAADVARSGHARGSSLSVRKVRAFGADPARLGEPRWPRLPADRADSP